MIKRANWRRWRADGGGRKKLKEGFRIYKGGTEVDGR